MACWWKFNHDCQVLTWQRIQALANAIYKPHSVKKSGVIVAIDKWERDIVRFEAATCKIAAEAKTFSLRQLVPEGRHLLITSNRNTLKTYEQVKADVNEQCAEERQKRSAGLCRLMWTLFLARSLRSPKVKEAKEHRLGGHGLKMDALERHGRVKVLETATARRVETIAYTSLRMSQNTQKLAALLKVQQTLSSSSSRPSMVVRRRGCDGGRCTGWQTGGPGRCSNTGHMTVLRVIEFPFVLGRGFDIAEIEVLVWQAITRGSCAYPSLTAHYDAESKNRRDRACYCITSNHIRSSCSRGHVRRDNTSSHPCGTCSRGRERCSSTDCVIRGISELRSEDLSGEIQGESEESAHMSSWHLLVNSRCLASNTGHDIPCSTFTDIQENWVMNVLIVPPHLGHSDLCPIITLLLVWFVMTLISLPVLVLPSTLVKSWKIA